MVLFKARCRLVWRLIPKYRFMPKELFPSFYECDCGHISHFFENIIRATKEASQPREIHLYDGATVDQDHIIVFSGGKMVDIICPNQPPEPPE